MSDVMPVASVVSVRDFGAKGDGVADDTAAIQHAVDVFSGQQRTGCILFPVGTYRTTAPIVYRGAYSQAVRIMGEVSSAGMSGAYLMYDGANPACAVLEIAGGADVIVEHLGLDTGPGGAQYGLYAHHDPTRTANGVGVNHLTLDHVVIGGRGTRPGSACLSLGVGFDGVPDTHQCDDIQIQSCKFVGGEKGVVIGNDNVKNFFITRTALWFANYGIDYGVGGSGSGVCSIRDCNFLQNKTSDVRMGTGVLTMDACQSEGSGALLVNYGNSGNPANARIVGCNWDSKSLSEEDVIIKFQGALRIVGCQFANNRTPASVPGIRLDWGDGQPSTLVSEQNYYKGAAADMTNGAGRPVFSRGDGTSLLGSKAAGPSVRTFGDYGGSPGKIARMTAPLDPAPLSPPTPTPLRASELVMSGPIRWEGKGGSIDFGDGRKWTPDGLFLAADRFWTADGLYPGGGIKWPGSGGLGPGEGESLRYVGWSIDKNGNRRSGFVVPPLKGNK